MKKIYIVYDCPWNECDKPWLYEGLYKTYGKRVIRIDPKYNLFKLSQMGILGKIKRYFINMYLILKVALNSQNNDIIICWNSFVGLFMKLFCKNKIVLSLNWLTPNRNRFKKLKVYCFKQKTFFASVNTIESISLWENVLSLKDGKQFFYLPDVPSSNVSYKILPKNKDKYCFTGGINNRDWEMIIKIARRNPEWSFVCCANEKTFKEAQEQLYYEQCPSNMKVFFDIPADEYYELMSKSSLVLLPLKVNRVSGLINLLKANQYGLLTISSSIPGISAYYPKELYDLLIPLGNDILFENKIAEILNYDVQKYIMLVEKMRKHQRDNFSQDKAIECILKIVNPFMKIDVDTGNC